MKTFIYNKEAIDKTDTWACRWKDISSNGVARGVTYAIVMGKNRAESMVEHENQEAVELTNEQFTSFFIFKRENSIDTN